MENEKIVYGLDIGTTKIVCLAGKLNEHGKLEILGVGKSKSLGVKRGIVNNIMQTVDSINHAVEIVHSDYDLQVNSVCTGIAGQHIRSLQHSDYITRQNPEKFIDNTDIEKLHNNVKKLILLPGEEMIHVLAQEYKIDGETNIDQPEGMYGSRLEASFHIVAGQTAAIKNITRCVVESGLKINALNLEPLASADAVLSDEEKEAGVVLVDIGGGTTDVAIFKNGIIRHTAVIPFGGNVITDDIKEGCSIIEKDAEALKIRFGSAWPSENKDTEIVSIPGLRGREPKEISLKNLSKIIKARVEEIIDQVYRQITSYGFQEGKNKLIAGIVLTGGGSQLKHIKQLTEYITGMSTRIGYANEHLAKGTLEEISHPSYATSVGLVLRGLKTNNFEDIQELNNHSQKKGSVNNTTFFENWSNTFLKYLLNE
ncbi:MAG: cell division protein FtsA [Flavobacteriales bacterium]|nr:cell division protein FtsA [Flavobacteriales bacterium]|tara:strand:+ start:4104 stop:5381 length:1278 start_codon:yes stop_codon:yes gene_type:complete